MDITPQDLCHALTRLNVGDSHYDFTAQRRLGLDTTMATTFRATQTHTGSGRPNDNDND